MGITLQYKKGQTPINEEEKDSLIIKAISLQSELATIKKYLLIGIHFLVAIHIFEKTKPSADV